MFKVLIIDDTKSVHSFVKNILSKSKEISTVSVFNGAEGLDLLKSNKDFNLILLDWEMPILNGPDTFVQLKGMNLGIPTVMMTTKNAPEDIAKMLNLGVAEYLLKPFTSDILFEKLEFVSGRAFLYAA